LHTASSLDHNPTTADKPEGMLLWLFAIMGYNALVEDNTWCFWVGGGEYDVPQQEQGRV